MLEDAEEMERSIPACAGEPFRSDRLWQPTEVLSPRVRGNRVRFPTGELGIRSIPACAGEPTANRNPASAS